MVTKWQTLFLLVMTLPIMGHVVILPIMLDVAGRDIFISILISLPAALLLAFVIFRLRLNYPDLSATDMFVRLLGKWGGIVLTVIFILYFLFLTIISFASLVDFVFIGFFPETPIIALIIFFLIFFLYGASKGIHRIASTAGLLTFIGVITGHTITLMDAPKKDWSEMLPLLEFGWSPPMWGALILISIWVEMLFLLCIPIKNIHEKRFFLIWTIAVLINALTMFSTANGVITIFGLGQAENFTYPAQEIVRIINLGVIDRFDIYGMVLMTFGVYIRCTLYFRIVYELSLPEKASKWLKKTMYSLFIVLTFIGTYYLAKEHFRVEESINIYAYMIILFPIPFILLFISWIKERKKDN